MQDQTIILLDCFNLGTIGELLDTFV
ncbi:hypothetical protein XNC1_3119 [Xenorhabdus nematophila ATCC 19061]|uniref:Uncharacterized protein n=1 Tax=Xenorhabdus nematophila (strain ATCC 19061 / DSM 3370 / CCUG 14189 / LMG 1036 / NCIMB 9965 / AN6) TaxID=406817 RepID=D3VKR5_XENNA|nr:hypothetical protein XNC1_3119 [Xenorhabdus nematophila ATCC 19061]